MNEEAYQALREEANGILVETETASRLEILRGKWMLGEAVFNHLEYVGQEKGGRGVESFATRFAKDLSADGRRVSPREVRRCVNFYVKYPNLHIAPGQSLEETEGAFSVIPLPGGKTLSWKLISRELLPEPTKVFRITKNDRVLAYSQQAVGRIWTDADHLFLKGQLRGNEATKANESADGSAESVSGSEGAAREHPECDPEATGNG
jgi:hypothetical protein